MRIPFAPFIAGICLLVAGCTTGWDITLTSGSKIAGVSKPKLDRENGVYVFKDASGQPSYVSMGRVRVIEPHQRAKKPKDFKKSKSTSSQWNQ